MKTKIPSEFERTLFSLNAYVKVCRGLRLVLMPVEDYLDMRSQRYGFDTFEDLRKEGYTIDLPVLYSAESVPLSERETLWVAYELGIKSFDNEANRQNRTCEFEEREENL